MEVKLHSFLTSALLEVFSQLHTSAALLPGLTELKKTAVHTAGMDVWRREKSQTLLEFEPLTIQPVA